MNVPGLITLVVIAIAIGVFFWFGRPQRSKLFGSRTTRTFTIGVPGCVLGAWLVMLGLGVWHASAHVVPTIGFWPALILCAGLSLGNDLLVHYKWTVTR